MAIILFLPPDIYVPPDQVLDTVDLYYSPTRQRKISLRFLAWFLLKNDIQLGEHDSIEDARTALQLYKLWLRFEEDGRLDDVMDDIFAEGKRLVCTSKNRHVDLQRPGFTDVAFRRTLLELETARLAGIRPTLRPYRYALALARVHSRAIIASDASAPPDSFVSASVTASQRASLPLARISERTFTAATAGDQGVRLPAVDGAAHALASAWWRRGLRSPRTVGRPASSAESGSAPAAAGRQQSGRSMGNGQIA